jgi:ribonuclease HI
MRVAYSVVSQEEVIELGPLPAGTSTQKAELVALTRALILRKGKKVNLYTDSK